MLNKIIGFAIKNKLIVGLFTLALVGFGVLELSKLPIDAVPDITNNQVQVITVAPSFGATDIERLVTFPIEQATTNIPGLKESRSFSRFGLSLVTLVFEDNIDIYKARQQVSERLQKARTEIPEGIGTPELGPVSTGLGEIYQYVVRPAKGFESKYDVAELRTIQDWIVRRQLLGVKGVAEVSSFGGKLKQYTIEIDPNKLQSFGLTINDVFKAVESNNQNTGGAYIEKSSVALFIRSEGLITSMSDIGNIPVKRLSDGTPVLVRNVANITIGNAIRYGAMCYNDEGEVAGAVVMMLKGANSSEVIKNVKERIEQIKKTLPPGVIIEPFLDRTKMVNNAIGTVEKNLAEGALIVVFVLVLFLGNLRAGLIVASVIPLSMLFAVIMMNMFHVSGNLMSLGALDFGLIVDGAVIIVEAVMHRLMHSKTLSNTHLLTRQQMDNEVKTAAGKMMNSAVFGQIIILIVYLPIFTLEGIEGKMFKPMAQTVAFALLGAFILSLTYVPMMSALFLSRKLSHKLTLTDKAMIWVEKTYQQMLNMILQIPKTVISAAVILFVVAVIILSRMGGEFIPSLEEGDFAVDTRVLTGSSLTTTIENTQKTAHILKSRFPEVEKVVTKIGSGEVPTDPMPMEASDMMVILKDKKEWTSAKTFDELAEKMGKAISEVPGVTAGFQFPVQMRFNELMTGARQDVVCKIFGEDLDTLAAYAHALGNVVNTVKGATNLYVEPVSGMPQIVITYNRDAIAQHALNVADINKVVNAAFAGQQTGMVYEGEKRFELVVRLSNHLKQDVKDVQQLLIPTAGEAQVPLYMLADVQIKDGPNQIQREEAKRRIIVGFNVRGRDVESIVKELQQKTAERIKLPAGYYITYGGAFENLNAAKERLLIAVPVSLLLIFLLLYFAFGSLRQGLLIYTAIPLSAIGGVFSLAARDMPFSISAGVGFIALFGVAVLNGIVLIAEFNQLKKEGLTDLRRIVIMGTKVRLRPVLMTAYVASLGFLPMALSNGAGAEVQRPLATVVIGGLLTATFLTLFVLPVLYIAFEKRFDKKMKAKSLKKPIVTTVVLLLAFTGLQAQPITLNDAIDSALKNNFSIKQEKLMTEYKANMIRSAVDIPQINLVGEMGQINSIYTDTKLSLTQSVSFPTIYSKQKKLYTAEWQSSLLSLELRKKILSSEVSKAYYHVLYLQAKKDLLTEADSIYQAFLEKANLRFDKGATDIMEKTTISLQSGQIKKQLTELNADIDNALRYFRFLLQTNGNEFPALTSFRMKPSLYDSAMLVNHILLLQAQQQVKVAAVSTELEKSKLLPDLFVGYNNMSIKGVGADEKNYGTDKRFSSVQLGVGIPLFSGAQKSRIQGAKINEKLAAVNYESLQKEFQNAYTVALMQYNKYRQTVAYFDAVALKQASLIPEVADKQFIKGTISYLEWVQLINQSITVKSDYIEAVKLYNESILQLNYITGK